MITTQSRRIIVLLSAALLTGAPGLRAQDDRAILTLTVNQVPHGTVVVRLRDGDVFMQVSDLERAGVRNFSGQRETIDEDAYVSLVSLAPAVAYVFDEEAVALRLTAQPALLASTVLELQQSRPANILYSKESSAFVNYAFATQQFKQPTFFSEAGLSLRGNLLFGSVTRTPDGRLQRGPTSLTFDNRTRLRRWVVGDTFASAGGLGGVASIGGITLTREFGLDPYYIRYPLPSLSGTTAVPAELEVYINGILMRRESLPPGQFELKNLPVVGGRGAVQLLLRDSFGRVQEIQMPYYFARQLLSKGTSEYNYHLGVQRNQPGIRNWDYGPPVFLAQHRYGFAERFTAGFRLEGDPHLVSGGAVATMSLLFGEVELAASSSRTERTSGHAASLSYSYLGRPVSVGASVRMLSPQYTTVSLTPETDRATRQLTVSASSPLGRRASFTMQHTTADYRDRARENRFSLFSSIRVAGQATLIVSGAHAHGGGAPGRNEFFIGLNYYLKHNHSVTVSQQQQDADGRTSVQVQHPLPPGTGVGYRFRADSGQGGPVDALVRSNGPFGRYEAELNRNDGLASNTVRLSGGIVSLGGRLHLTRPVQDAFALIRLPDGARVRGYASNQEIGRTNTHGELLIPNLLSYYGNPLRIDPQDLPLNYAVEATERLVAPPFRGGAVVEFPVQRLQSLVGTMLVINRGEDAVPANGELTILDTEPARVSPLGAQGEFYLENVPAGPHPAQVDYSNGTCQFTLTVPASTRAFVDLGALRCTIP